MLRRRGFLAGLALALSAPAIIRTPGLLMPVKPASPDHLTLNGTPIYPDVYCPPGHNYLFNKEAMGAHLEKFINGAGGEAPGFIVMNPRDFRMLARSFRMLGAMA